MDSELTRYITENRERYTREAIDAHLLRAGHTQADIDAAWSGLDQERPTAPGERTFWRAFLGSVAAMYGITFLVYAVSFGRSLILTGILLIFLLLAAWLSIAMVRKNPPAAAGTTSGLLAALVIPFVALVIVAGLCSVTTGVP